VTMMIIIRAKDTDDVDVTFRLSSLYTEMTIIDSSTSRISVSLSPTIPERRPATFRPWSRSVSLSKVTQ